MSISGMSRGSVSPTLQRQGTKKNMGSPPARTDFLSNMRKPSSQAFPLFGKTDTTKMSKEELYEFENKLRDVIAELLKPVNDK